MFYTACSQQYLFIFNQLSINFAVPRAFGQTHSLTSFGRAFGFFERLDKCEAFTNTNENKKIL